MTTNQLEKTFWEHFKDLKSLIIKLVLSWFVGTIGVSYYKDQLIDLVISPIKSRNVDLHFLSPTDGLLFILKIISVGGLVVSLPLMFFFVWRYLQTTLLDAEKKFVAGYILAGSVFSLTGILYGYYYLIPVSLRFLLDFNLSHTRLTITANEYVGFLSSMILILVLVFQTPIVVFGLVKSGLVPASSMHKKRKEIYFAILVLLAAFGSPDAMTWLMSSAPVLFLFEASLWLAGKQTSKIDKVSDTETIIESNLQT